MVVFNDAALSLIAIKQSADGHGGPAAVSYARTDFAAVAAGFGIRAERVSDADVLSTAFEAALRHDGPSLLDVDRRPVVVSGDPRRHPRRVTEC